MKRTSDSIYNFVYRGQLTEEALDRAGRTRGRQSEIDRTLYSKLLAVDELDVQHVENARAMATVYTAVAAFENSVRELISKTLLDEVGENWWNECVSAKIRKQADERRIEEEKVRWHNQRGASPINYTMLPQLMSIIRQNPQHFEPFIHDLEWASNVFEVIDRSRNVIMHSGMLNQRDIARLGTFIRDWTSQVST